MRPSGPRPAFRGPLSSYLRRCCYAACTYELGGNFGRRSNCSDEFGSGDDLDPDDLRDGRNLDHARQGLTTDATLGLFGSLPLMPAHGFAGGVRVLVGWSASHGLPD